MTSTSQNASYFPTSKKMLLDPHEEVYTKQKDIRKHIEIRVSELIDKEGPNQEEYYASEDNFFQKNSPNHPNVSVKILEEYHLKQTPKQSVGATRSREKIKSSSSVGALASEPADHRVGNMFKWKERVHKKQEMQREFQEQLRSSMYDYKVFTNDLSNQMLESIRPNTKVEDILLLKGQAKQMKMKKIEEQLYGGNRVPSITKMAKRLNSSQNVYSRLYDVDKHRREKSREILMKSQNQNQTMDSIGTSTGTRHRSRSEGKRKNVLSAFMSPAHRGTQNTDFCFSPKEVTSPIAVNQTSDAHFGRDTTFSLQQTAVTSPMGTSPLYSVKNANSKNIFIQSSLNQSNEDIFSSLHPSPANNRKIAERPRTGAISIYKRLTPAPKNNKTTQSFQQSSSQNKQQKSPKNRDKSINRQQSWNQDHTEKQKRSGGMSPSESTPVLPNMIFFKNIEQRQGASTPTHENHKDNHRKNQSKGLEKNKKEPYDMRSMELFWEKILQDDSEGRGRKKSDLEVNVADRGKMWAEKKNKKLEDQRKQKEEKELENCTFKPQLQYQDQPNKNMQLYFNFLERIANTKSVSSSSNSTIGPQNPVQNYSAMKSNLTIQTGNSSSVVNQGGHSGDSHENENNARYTADPNLQKKIYNYILNIPN